MIESKGWDWEIVTDSYWEEPSEDVYYYLHRWKEAGFERMLDLGCGPGRHAALFARNGFEVSALDISDYVVERLRETASKAGLAIDARAGDMLELPYPAGSFDCLIAYHSISHTDSEGIVKVIAEIRRVLKEGGELFLTVCSKNAWHFLSDKCPRIDANTTTINEGPEQNVPHYHADTGDMKNLFAAFRIIRLRHVEDILEWGSSFHYFIHARK